nr:hypothetical protein [Tanacetum cinerariifolium]
EGGRGLSGQHSVGECLFGLPRQAANVGRCLVSAAEDGSQLEECLFGLPRQAANVGRCLVSADEEGSQLEECLFGCRAAT